MKLQTRSFLVKSIQLSLLVIGGCLHFQTADACQMDGENKKNAKVFVSQSDRVTKYNLNTYELRNCQQDVQISKTIELPSPQNFATESWMKETATGKRQCSISNTESVSFADPSLKTADLVAQGDQCLGLNVQETAQKPISISLSKNCQIVSKKSESQLLLKGENCRISGKGLMNLKIDWVVLSSCQSMKEAKVDLNFRLRTAEVSRQPKSTSQPEIVLDKKVEMLFENGNESQPRYKLGEGTFSIRKSDQYEIDFDFLNLTLLGSKHTQLRVKSEYLVRNNGLQKSPFVLTHTLFLVKNKNYGSPILLGRWYTGAYLPGQWMGMDGLSETFNFGPAFDSFELNEFKSQIMAGDILVLKTEMLSPNKGPQRFVDFFNEQLKKYQKKNPAPGVLVTANPDKIDEIKPIIGVEGIKLIPEIDQSWSDPKTTAFTMIPLSPVRYQQYCLNKECRSFEDIEALPEVRVSFLVEEAEIGMKFQPLEVLKRNFKNEIKKTGLKDMSRITCY